MLLNKQGTFGRLARLNAGESLDSLVAEYQGTPLPEAVVEPAAVAEAAAVAEPAPSLIERATATVAAAVESVQEAVQAVIGSDEEE